MSELNTNKDKAIDRIKKLLAMGTDERSNEQERETSMRMALALLAKHNMDMSDVATEIEKEKRNKQELEQFPCPWRRTVGNAIAEMFFCKFFSTNMYGKQKKIFTFVGLESNAVTALEMTKYLINSITKEGRKEKKRLGGDHAFETSFFNGAAWRISERCRALKAEAEMENTKLSTGTALTLVNVYEQEIAANIKFIAEEMGIKLVQGKGKGMSIKDHSAFGMGREFGNGVSLNNQLSNSGAKKTKATAIK